MTELPSIYRDPVHYDLIAQMTAPKDLPFYQRLVSSHGGPVLELACGTGRVCIELARQGLEIWGIDNSQALLTHAVHKAAAAQKQLTLKLADVRSFDLQRCYSLILLPYNAFNHLLDLESLERCFSAVHAHMDGDTLWVIDTFNPDPEKLQAQTPRRKILTYLDPESGRQVLMYEHTAYDAAAQINKITWSYEVQGALVRTDELSMRIYFPQELDALLQLGGFEIVEKLGDYDGSPFEARKPKQLLICRSRRTDAMLAPAESPPT